MMGILAGLLGGAAFGVAAIVWELLMRRRYGLRVDILAADRGIIVEHANRQRFVEWPKTHAPGSASNWVAIGILVAMHGNRTTKEVVDRMIMCAKTGDVIPYADRLELLGEDE